MSKPKKESKNYRMLGKDRMCPKGCGATVLLQDKTTGVIYSHCGWCRRSWIYDGPKLGQAVQA